MSLWMLTDTTLAELRDAVSRVGADQLVDLAARGPALAAGNDPILTQDGDVARIRVQGILSPRFDVIAHVFLGGSTSYPDIVSALRQAEADSSVRSIELHVDSPGGAVVRLFETMDAVAATTKPTKAVVRTAASAAYGLAAAADSIEAVHASSTFGSIGIVATLPLRNDVVDVTSTEAPDKRPDPATDDGRAAIRRHLDDVAGLFAQSIARGRGVSVQTVHESFGRGGLVLAEDAQRRGMIDSIQPRVRRLGDRSQAAQAREDAARCDAVRRLGLPRDAALELLASNTPTAELEARAQQHRADDFHDQVATAVERKMGVTPQQPAHAAQRSAQGEDFAGQVADRVERMLGLDLVDRAAESAFGNQDGLPPGVARTKSGDLVLTSRGNEPEKPAPKRNSHGVLVV